MGIKGFLQAEKVVEESLAAYAKKAKGQEVKEGIRKARAYCLEEIR